MNRLRVISTFGLTVLFSATALLFSVRAATNEFAMEGFSVKEYEDFHRVLRPLQHEALPKKDFQRIRARAGELTKLGRAITAGRSSRDTAGKCGGVQKGAEKVWQSTDRI